MPYIGQDDRGHLDSIAEDMFNAGIKVTGDLNYLLFAFCKRYVTPGYNNYKNFCGELRQCATEIERRLLGPYEDKKCKLNGDVE